MIRSRDARRGDAEARIRRSPLFDVGWYECQTGRRFRRRRSAVADYLADGHRRFTPHPLFEPAWLRHSGFEPAPGREPLSAYLDQAEGRDEASPHPLVDLAGLPGAEDDALHGDGGRFVRWLAAAAVDDDVPRPDAFRGRPMTLGEIHEVSRRLTGQWHALAEQDAAPASDATVDWDAAGSRRTPGLASVVLPVSRFPVNALRWLARLNAQLLRSGPAGLEVVVVSCAPDLTTHRLLGTVAAALDGVRILPVQRKLSWSAAANLGAASVRGDVVVVMHPRLAPWGHDWLPPLVETVRTAGHLAQPLVLDRAGLVSSAGAGFHGAGPVPTPILSQFPARDVASSSPVRVPSLLSPVFAVPAEQLVRLQGLDPAMTSYAEVELGLRARQAGLETSVVAASMVTDRPDAALGFPAKPERAATRLPEVSAQSRDVTRAVWAGAGFELVEPGRSASAEPEPPEQRTPAVARRPLDVRERPPRLRWTIDTAAPAGPPGELWGDLHFARSLAASLERLGQHVAIDRRPARDRPTRTWDDVILVLRGLDEVTPRAGAVNLQWVISHPDLVSAREVQGFDAVFAASTTWAQEAADRWGTRVTPLLQCTDPALFRPDRGEEDTGDPILFVGNTRKGSRPVVEAAIACRAEVSIYGRGWVGLAPAGWVKGRSVPNAELGAKYATAGVVLNDHHADMRTQGFLNNRLFDAAACGARVVSDHVAGIDALFGGSVRTFQTAAELCDLLAGDRHARFPDRDERLRTADRIRKEHSFDARANTLLEEAVRIWQRRTPAAC